MHAFWKWFLLTLESIISSSKSDKVVNIIRTIVWSTWTRTINLRTPAFRLPWSVLRPQVRNRGDNRSSVRHGGLWSMIFVHKRIYLLIISIFRVGTDWSETTCWIDNWSIASPRCVGATLALLRKFTKKCFVFLLKWSYIVSGERCWKFSGCLLASKSLFQGDRVFREMETKCAEWRPG